ncbi:MAG: hypothetical protein LBL04_06865 [Bacteroidales bacterium]|jgi:hypothetical protein|nr:hypothetical protein [Bacteroidales bacterium]
MNDFIEILKITLPSMIMLVTVYYIVGGFLRNSEKQQKLKAIRGNQKLITPIRLQAYERLVLLLERISPDSLVMRADYPDKTCEQLHTELLQAIRAEFEHNLSQRLYVSAEAWENVRNAKNYTVTLVNNAAKEVEDDMPAIELSRKILDMSVELEQPIAEKAINELKREIQQIF